MNLFDLQASEYTLIQLVVDASGSAASYRIEQLVKEIVRSCLSSDRKNNLILRVVGVGTRPSEIHDFKVLPQCDPEDYGGIVGLGGTTALYDAMIDGVEAVTKLSCFLMQQDYSANAVIIVISDGMDNSSVASSSKVMNALEKARKNESLDSISSILVGIVGSSDRNSPAYKEVSGALRQFESEIGFTCYREVDVLVENAASCLAEFLCESIYAVNNALGTGGPPSFLGLPYAGEINCRPSKAYRQCRWTAGNDIETGRYRHYKGDWYRSPQ
jgi:hypothetical protein